MFPKNFRFLVKTTKPKGGVKKSRGSSNVDKGWERGGSPRMWIKTILIVNIINFQNVDKPRGCGQC